MNLDKKIKKSIEFLTNLKEKDLHLAFSGGKDSVVIYHLSKLAKIECKYFHSNTTIDPKGTLKFIRENFKDVEILQPKLSFYQLVKKKGLPTRLARFCCEYLKEYGSIGKNVIEGVRSSESQARKGRDLIQLDNRKSQKGAKHIYPIYEWSDADVWGFIAKYNLPIAPAYSQGFNRLGCVGCPLVTRKGARVKEFMIEPKKLAMIKKGIKIGMENNPQWKLSKLSKGNENLAIEWWLSGKTMNEFDFNIENKLFQSVPLCV